MARIDNPFSLFEVDDDEVDPVAILARAEAKRIAEANAAAAAAAEQDQQQLEKPEKKDDAGGRAERGRGGGRGGRGRGGGRGAGGGESWGQYGDGYSRGYGGEYDGRGGGRGGRGGRGGSGRGRGRGYYEYRASGNGNGEHYGANRNQDQEGGGAFVEVEGGEGQEVQGRGYYGNRRGRSENSRFGEENHGSGWEARGYGGEGGRRFGGRGGRYERSENLNEPATKKEDAGEGMNLNEGNDAVGESAWDVPDSTEVPKDSENEVPKSADDEKANHEPVAAEDVSEKKNAEDDTMTLEEYEKVIFEKRKALEALKIEERKVDIDVVKSFGGMTLIEKKKEGVFVKMKSDKDKLKKAALEKEEKARKAMSINEFLKPAEGEFYMGPSYARERAARIRSERRAREEEEHKHATAEPGADVPVSSSSYGGGGRGRGRGRGQRGVYRGEFSSNGERVRARGDQGALRGGVTVPEGESDKEFLDKEFPVLGGAVKA